MISYIITYFRPHLFFFKIIGLAMLERVCYDPFIYILVSIKLNLEN